MKTALIYRDSLLPPSETFIQAQAGSLRRYQPQFVGVRACANSLLDSSACFIEQRGDRPAFLSKLRSMKPALLHAHFAPDGIAALPLAERLGIPLIVTLHGYDVTVKTRGRNPFRNLMQVRKLRQLHRSAALFLCVSEFIRRHALAAGYPSEKLVVHHIGIDTQLFDSAADVSLSSNVSRDASRDASRDVSSAVSSDVMFVGRLTEKKGCEYLIRAMAIVQQHLPSADLTIIGEGPLRSSLQALASDLGVRVSFLGLQSHESVRRHLARARVCAVPSVTAANGDSEGLPILLLEAQGLGVPVVATRHAGIPEGIVDGDAGMLSDEKDVQGLAENIMRMFTEEGLRADVSRRGRDLVRQHFNLQTQTFILEELYDRTQIIGHRAHAVRTCCQHST